MGEGSTEDRANVGSVPFFEVVLGDMSRRGVNILFEPLHRLGWKILVNWAWEYVNVSPFQIVVEMWRVVHSDHTQMRAAVLRERLLLEHVAP